MSEKPMLKSVRHAIFEGNKIIADFKQHSTGRLNLWILINDTGDYHQYNITMEAQSRLRPGITTAIVATLPMDEFRYKDFIDITMAFQKKWDVPVLTHAFPKDKLFNLRQKYGYRIIRDDIVRKF